MFTTTVSVFTRLVERGRCRSESCRKEGDSYPLRLRCLLISLTLTDLSHRVISGTAAIEATNLAVHITVGAAKRLNAVHGTRVARLHAGRSWMQFSVVVSVLCISQMLLGATVTSLWVRDLAKLGLFAAFIDSARTATRNT